MKSGKRKSTNGVNRLRYYLRVITDVIKMFLIYGLVMAVLFVNVVWTETKEDNCQPELQPLKTPKTNLSWVLDLKRAIGGWEIREDTPEPQIVVTHMYSGTLRVINNEGVIITDVQMQGYPGESLYYPDYIQFADVNKDGKVDVLVAKNKERHILGYDSSTGKKIWDVFCGGWFLHDLKVLPSTKMDGGVVLIAGFFEGIRGYNVLGKVVWENTDIRSVNSIEYADLDGDGHREIVCDAFEKIAILNETGSIKTIFQEPEEEGAHSFSGNLKITDWDNDGSLDIVCSGQVLKLGDHIEAIVVLNRYGKEIWSLESKRDFFTSRFVDLDVADLDNDGNKEVIVGTLDGDVLIYDNMKRKIWEYSSKGMIDFVRAYDMDGDGKKEIVFDSHSRIHVVSPILKQLK